MDTPEKNQIGTPIAKFEDSPVFNYINNLSPIKPVKSLHITQTFQSLSFASIPSVFTSPHFNSQRESRFLKRNHFAGSSKDEVSFDDGNEANISKGVSKGASDEPPNEHAKLAIKLPLQYDSLSPSNNATPSYAIKTDLEMEMVGTPASLVRFVQEGPQETNHLFETGVEVPGLCQLEQTKEEGPGCDWDNLISNASDLLIFNASPESEACRGNDKKFEEPDTNSFVPIVSKPLQVKNDDSQKTEPLQSLCSCNPQAVQLEIHTEEVGEQNGIDNGPNLIPNALVHNQEIGDLSMEMDGNTGDCVQIGCEVDIQQQRGLRRRCLVFEVAGTHTKRLEDDSKSTSANSTQFDGKFASDDGQFILPKPGIVSSPCLLPGIGLHLNTLATTSKDFRMVKQEISVSGRRLITMPKSVGSLHSVTPGKKPLIESLALNSIERGLVPCSNELHVMQNASHAPAFGVGEDFNQSSPKKKRRRFENGGESDACKRCNCKKSKCLKLYCECFAAGVYCVEPCSCQECFNKPVHEDTVLATRKQIESRNPLAFAPKVIRSFVSVPDLGEEGNKTPASARHKRGCNCKKSSCLKKYCECYQGGVGCSSNCRCEGCKNAFGRKDGTLSIGIDEAEPEEEESEACEKDGLNKNTLQIIEAQKDEQQYPEGVLPITPFQICRSSIKLPSFSSGKPPRSSLPFVGSSPFLKTFQPLRTSDFLHQQPKFEKNFQDINEEETPDILRSDCSPVHGVKTVSPNRKRVSPPHNELGSSPGRRSSRKLILQSIPSFPSLTSHPGTSDFPVKFQ
ncbi:protein tesmin/TSO1-like CXC 2 [Tasmannia lanceolata]|uniref:protein tesmin/TSO1-like CXC 2 n=1 Tax=Tasmannia lanceolata TaxID=3420 RepID=UPI004062DD93